MEAMFDRGWTDGLPVVPPTEARVLRMLEGTTRAPDEIVAVVPPDLVEVTVEKVAINAVMAGCKPEYLPVVLAARRGGLHRRVQHPRRARHHDAGRARSIIVNGPIRRAIGMNSRRERARPGQPGQPHASAGRCSSSSATSAAAGRAASTGPRTATRASSRFCFAEDEEGSPWEPLSVEPRGRSRAPTPSRCSPAKAPRCVVDQQSRDARVARARRSPPASAPCTTRSCRSASTPSSSCRPRARPGVRRGAAGSRARLAGRARRPPAAPGPRDRPRAPAASPRACPSRLRDAHAAEVPPRRPAASSTPAAARACSLPSSAAGPTAPIGSQPVTREVGSMKVVTP